MNAIYIPPEDNTAISRDAQIDLALQWLEEDEEQNTEKKENMIMRDSQIYHYDETSRGGQSTEIDGERTAGHDINTDREGFAYRLACPFLA